MEKADHRHPWLLRAQYRVVALAARFARHRDARRERPRRRAAESQDELAPPHSITSWAVASKVEGTSMPSAFAVLRLMMSSYLLGACTGRSAGLSPLRMRST